jgi:hypothetical protein
LQQLDRVTTAFTAASSEPNRDGHKDRLHSPVRQSQCRSKNTEKNSKTKAKNKQNKNNIPNAQDGGRKKETQKPSVRLKCTSPGQICVLYLPTQVNKNQATAKQQKRGQSQSNQHKTATNRNDGNGEEPSFRYQLHAKLVQKAQLADSNRSLLSPKILASHHHQVAKAIRNAPIMNLSNTVEPRQN